MAAPVITGTEPPSPLVFAPGETKALKILAYDPDNGPPVTQYFDVEDQAFHVTSIAVTLQIQDVLTYGFDLPPAGWVIVQDLVDPSVFHITAP